MATQTEIYDYLRLLFARIGTPHCPQCGKKIERQTAQEIVQQILSLEKETKINILAPLIKGKKGEYRNIQTQISKAGFARLRVDGKIHSTTDPLKLDKYKIHHIEVVVDRLSVKLDIRKRLTDSVETALKMGEGLVIANYEGKYPEKMFSENYACVDCGINLQEIEPRIFSFNSPYGACPDCNGLGTKMEIDPDLLCPDDTKPWIQAIAPWKRGRRNYMMYYRAVMREIGHIYGVKQDIPLKNLDKRFRHIIFHGSNDEIWGRGFEGVLNYMQRLFRGTDSDWLKDEISHYMSVHPCTRCNGARLKKESLAVRVAQKNITEVSRLSIKEAREFFVTLKLAKDQKIISEQILKEIIRRLDFCINVGLEYLTLDRKSATLSGGEAERIRLATQVGSGLVGVVYILDEPSIGLHQKDNERLLSTLHALRDLGNTLIVVEHDEATIRNADFVIDLGPGAGEFGGEVIYAGDVAGILKCKRSLTGQYLIGDFVIKTPEKRREIVKTNFLKIVGAQQHNLKKVNVSFPLGTFICVTGVSGSGKSTLIDEVLYKALAKNLYNAKEEPGRH